MMVNFLSVSVVIFALLVAHLTAAAASVNDDFGFIRRAILEHLEMEDVPDNVSDQDVRRVEIPHELQQQYDSMRELYDSSQGSNVIRSRQIRSSREPSLAKLFRTVHRNAGVSGGDLIYTNTFREKMVFDLESRIPEGSRVTTAQLRLYKKLPNFSTFPESSRPYPENNRLSLKKRRAISHARVSIYMSQDNGVSTPVLIDSREVAANGSGWINFDVTPAVERWRQHPVKYMYITLELHVESSSPGRAAAEVAKSVRFTGQRAHHSSPFRPELVLTTKEIEAPSGRAHECSNKRGRRQKCCREKSFIDFRELNWSQGWIVEPRGFFHYSCGGRCSSKYSNYKQCVPTQLSSLPIMYISKSGDQTEVKVATLPNMIIEQCGCSSNANPFLR